MVFFPLFNREYQNYDKAKFELYYIIRTDSAELLRKRYTQKELDSKNIVFLKEYNNRFKRLLENLELVLRLIVLRIDILQVIQLDETLEPINTLRILQFIKRLVRIRTVFTITYNGVPTAFKNNFSGRFANDLKYKKLFQTIRFNGIYTWYAEVIEWVKNETLFIKKPITESVESRFCDITKYCPEEFKEKLIVWAGALVNYKRPEMLIEALHMVMAKDSKLLVGWKVVIIGDGIMKEQLQQLIDTGGLSGLVEICPASLNYNMLLNKASIMVSTQAIDHFPNLTINEGMSSGCIMVATNIGRVKLFVKHNVNGLLSETDDALGVANQLEILLSKNDEQMRGMMQASRQEILTNHRPDTFIEKIESFWSKILESSL
jgi:glycosyltransferase involved in cell wall biosynthesis